MNRLQPIKNFFNKLISKRIQKAFLISFLTFIVLNLIAYARFDSCVDVMQQSVLCNITGLLNCDHTVFSNILLTKVLAFLQRHIAFISWYTWMLTITAFIGIWILTWIFIKIHQQKPIIIVEAFVFNIFLGYEGYMFPNYIKSALIFAMAMVVLLLYIALVRKDANWVCAPIVAGLVYASLISVYGMVFGLVAGLFIYFVHLRVLNLWSKRCALMLLVLVLACLLSFAMNVVDSKYYESQGGDWSATVKYEDSIQKLLVFGMPEYDRDWEEEMGVSEKMYTEFSKNVSYFVADRNQMDHLEFFARLHHDYNPQETLGFFRTVPVRWIKVGFTYLFIFILYLFYKSQSKGKKWFIALSIAYVFLVYYFAYMNYAWNNKIIQIFAFIPSIYLLLLNSRHVEEVDMKEMAVVLVLSAVILYNNFSNQIVTSAEEKAFPDVLAAIEQQPNQIMSMNINWYLKKYSAYHPYESESLAGYNVVIGNGFYAIYPMYDAYMIKNYMGWDMFWTNNDDGKVKLQNYIIAGGVYDEDTESIIVHVQ